MKNTQFLLSAVGISAVALSALFIKSNTVANMDYVSLKNHYKEFEEVKEQSAEGAMEWYKMTRANQVTGLVNPLDVMAAKDEANRLLKMNSKTRGPLSAMKWDETGPNNVGGRCRALITDKNNSNRLYLASSGGGLSISDDGGNTWNRRAGNDSAAAPAVCALTQAVNGDIYYGTGEGFGAGIPYTNGAQTQLGEGIFKSTDGGLTFNQLSSTKPSSSNSSSDQWAFIQKLIAHPTDANKIFAATGNGFKVTKDGGATWAKPASLNSSAFVADVESSTDGNRVVVSTNTAIYISNDAGETFGASIMGLNGMPASAGLGRIDIAIAPSNADYIYACLAGSNSQLKGIYKSTDGGVNWTTIGIGGSAIFDPLGSQAFWNIAFGVHPTNPEMVFLGGQLDLYRYTPATTWVAIANWLGSPFSGTLVHADMHGIMFNPTNPSTMYVVNDGGFYRTFNCDAANPFFAEKNNNAAVTQCYGVSANTLGHVVIGSQDNGSHIMGTSVNSPKVGKPLTGGDGMRSAISSLNPKVIITSTYGGAFTRATDGGLSPLSFKSFFDLNIDANEDGDPEEGAIWNAPIFLKEKYSSDNKPLSTCIIGTNSSIWMTQGATTSKAVWFNLMNQSGVGYSAITVPKNNNKIVYVGTSGGAVYRIDVPNLLDSTYKYFDTIDNKGAFPYSALIKTTLIANFGGRYVTDVAASADGAVVYVTLGNYGNSSYIYKSIKADTASSLANAAFTDFTGSLPKMPIYSAVCADGNPNRVIIGTELGVWGSENVGSPMWQELNLTGPDPAKWHPRVATYEVIEVGHLQNSDGSGFEGPIVYTGTHGRGSFRSTSLGIYWPTNVQYADANTESISVYPNPTVDMATITYNASLAGNTTIRIYSLTGSLVKTYNTPVKTGANSIQLNVSDLSTGGYIVYLSNGAKKATTKLIKQ
jgi:photosystem II stability/assembly factor-like uncharacterized protein